MTTDPQASAPNESDPPESAGRQPVVYCPYCAEETLFPREGGGWECRSCLRAFQVSFLGLVQRGAGKHGVAQPGGTS